MTSGPRARATAALASAAMTLVAAIVLSGLLATPSRAQTQPCGGLFPPCTTTTTTTTTTAPTSSTTPPPQWEGSSWNAPTADGQTVTDGTFSGEFKYSVPAAHIVSTDLGVKYSPTDTHASACGDGKQSLTQNAPSTSTTAPAAENTMDFLFEVAFVCNGIYDVTATATSDTDETHDLALKNLKIAVPPPSPLALNATDNGNQTVTITWQHPTNPPVDTIGYRLSKRSSSAQTFTPITDTDVDATTFADTGYPSAGGSFVYKVETLRKSPVGTLTSEPVVTEGALTVNGVAKAGQSGGTVGGTVPPAPDSGGQFFDSTLPGADEELGAPNASVPGGDTIQRFTGDDTGAGLIKPFAAALDLGVWAGLLLFLTRRAASAERAALRSVHVERSSP